MREIIIKSVSKEGKKHVVRLGNGTVFEFSNSKAANKFLADTNKFLTEKLFACNVALTDIYEHSRSAWMVDPAARGDFGKDEIGTFEYLLFRAHFLAPTKNGNFFSFINLLKFCRLSKEYIKKLLSLKLSQRDTIMRHKLNQLFETLFRLETEINAYGQTTANALVSMSHIEDNERFININAA